MLPMVNKGEATQKGRLVLTPRNDHLKLSVWLFSVVLHIHTVAAPVQL